MKSYCKSLILAFIIILLFLSQNVMRSQSIQALNSKIDRINFQIQSYKYDTIRTSKNIGSYLAEFGTGAFMGGLVALPAGIIGTYIDKSGNHGDFAGLGGFLIGISAGYILGSALGVHIIESSYYNHQSELWDALLGSVTGAAVGGFSLWQMDNVDEVTSLVVVLACPVIGAILAVNTIGNKEILSKKIKVNYFNFKINNKTVHSINLAYPLD